MYVYHKIYSCANYEPISFNIFRLKLFDIKNYFYNQKTQI